MSPKDHKDKQGKPKRSAAEMPADVKLSLEVHELRADFDHRPAYQRNEYLLWITRASRAEIRLKRLNQMLQELERGGVYMRADHPASKK
jgi:uncharacterized protein YdeI (YjbR/CyaY-like superfamily)